MDATQKVIRVIQEWPDWSRHERAKLEEITEEILDHCRNGTGNRFIQKWCANVLVPALAPLFSGPVQDRV
jgi:hypothetical protein